MLTTACCLVVGLWLGLGIYLVSVWLLVMHTYSYYFLLSLSLPYGETKIELKVENAPRLFAESAFRAV